MGHYLLVAFYKRHSEIITLNFCSIRKQTEPINVLFVVAPTSKDLSSGSHLKYEKI